MSSADEPHGDSTGPSSIIQAADSSADEDEFFAREGSLETMSITPSVFAHTFEHGRRYHSYKHGRYPIPNDDIEQNREDMKHAMMLELTDGTLFYAPIGEYPQNIVDIGTGTGIWAISVACEYPSASVLGIDLSPIQPLWVPPNVRFLVDDCEDEWIEGNYDLVHFRNVILVLKKPSQVLQRALQHTKPGGWIELQEIDYEPMCDDGTMTADDPIKTMYDLVVEAFAKLNTDFAIAPKIGGYLSQAGYTNIHCVVKKVPIGVWALDKTLRLVGLFQKIAILDVMPAFAGRPFEALGMSPEEREAVHASVIKALNEQGVHRYVKYYFWYAQKPNTT